MSVRLGESHPIGPHFFLNFRGSYSEAKGPRRPGAFFAAWAAVQSEAAAATMAILLRPLQTGGPCIGVGFGDADPKTKHRTHSDLSPKGQFGPRSRAKKAGMPLPFAILRCEKIRDWSTLEKSVGHNLRTSLDKRVHLDNRTKENQLLVGSETWVTAWRQTVAGMWLAKLKQGTRHTLAREFFLGASPEFFAGMGEAEIQAWANESLRWLQRRFGSERVALCVLHLDEQSPHLAAYVVGLKQDLNRKGEPNARGNGWTLSESAIGLGGGKDELVKMQDDYASEMAKFGLNRGIKGSTASHKKTAEWRGQMAVPLDAPIRKPKVAPPTFQDRLNPHEYAKRISDETARSVFSQMKPYHQQAKSYAAENRKLLALIESFRPLAEAFRSLAKRLLGTSPDFATIQGLEAAKEAVFKLTPAAKMADPPVAVHTPPRHVPKPAQKAVFRPPKP